MDTAVKDFIRVTSEEAEHTDYHSSDISTFVNTYFIFYVPPPTNRFLDSRSPNAWDGYKYKTGNYIVANLSNIQLFSYENGAKVKIEWLNASAINGTSFNSDNENWVVDQNAVIKWISDLPRNKLTKREYKLGEYESEDIQINNWVVWKDFRLLSGVVKITSDYPISVMHHKLYPIGTMDDNGLFG